jgi:hypothetical protein
MSTIAYVEQIAKIREVTLGWESHGILTCMVHLDYGGSSQSAGGYSLDEPVKGPDGEFLGRRGTAYGMEWVARLMRATGVESFADIQGRTVIALREDGFSGLVRGLKPLPTEPGSPFLFGDLAEEFNDAV